MQGRPPSRRARRTVALALCVLACATARSSAAQALAASSLPDLQVDLSGQLFTNVLPFDVPFLIHGDVPVATTRVEVSFIGAAQPFRVCDPGVRAVQARDAGNPSPTCPKSDHVICFAELRGGGEKAFDCAWQPDRSGPITWVQQLPPAANATTVTFRVAVPPLEASSFYAFKFVLDRKLTADEVAQIQAEVKKAADAALAGNTGTQSTEGDNEAVRTALVQQVQKLAGGGVKVDAQHRLLDPNVSYKQLTDAEKLTISQHSGDVIQAQHDRAAQLLQRSDKQLRLEPQLQAIAGSGALDRLIGALRDKAASAETGSALLAEHLKRHEPALHLADLSPQETAQHALGVPREPGNPPVDLGAAKTPAEAAPYVAGYSDTAERLADLQSWLEMQLKEVPRSAGLSAADLDELRQLLDTTAVAQDRAEQLTEHARSVQESLANRDAALTALAAACSAAAAEADLLLSASSLGDFKTQQSFYIAADFGFAYGPNVKKVVPYFGTNIYFRPVNKNAPLRTRSSLGRRLSMTVGLTVKSIADSNPQTRSDLFDSNSLLVGLGYRVTDSARLGAGLLVFNELNPNPLLSRQKVTYSPYLSLSFDWDILSFFRGFGALFPSNP